MLLIRGKPLKELLSGLLPSSIFRIASQPCFPRRHAAGGCLRQPHSHFDRSLAGVPPDGVTHIVGASYVCSSTAAHHAVRDPALLGAVPHRSCAAAILMIGIHPFA